jgi:site-specific recombinase XerD
VIILLTLSTGLRVGELTSLRRADVCTDLHAAHIAIHGKGRKHRITPIDQTTHQDAARLAAREPRSTQCPALSRPRHHEEDEQRRGR